MKHAITILENALRDVQENAAKVRPENKTSARLIKAVVWDLLMALEVLRRQVAEMKKGGRP